MAGEVVVGYDGSAGAQAAIREAVPIAKAFAVPLVAVFAHGANPVGGVTGDIERATASVGERFLDEAVKIAATVDPEVVVECQPVNALPVEGLVGVADRLNARMIIVGGNGHGPLAGALLGSVSYKLLHVSERPVLVVQPPD